MGNLPNCPKCNSEYTYEDGNFLNCPECFHEWTAEAEVEKKEDVNIKLIHEPSDGEHDISCKIDGFGAMLLKSSVVKKIG